MIIPDPPSPSGNSPPPKRFKPSSPPLRASIISPSPALPPAPPTLPPPARVPLDPSLKPFFVDAHLTKSQLSKKRKTRRPLPEAYSAEDVLFRDVRDFLGAEYVDGLIEAEGAEEWAVPEELKEKFTTIVQLRVGAFTVSGDCLALYQPEGSDKKWAVVTPFAHPGDLISAKIVAHSRLYSKADLVEILEYDDTLRGGEGDRRKNPSGGCKYFGICGGCQLQPLPYTSQLAHKTQTVHLAYSRFSQLSSSQLPTVLPTIPSPKQWQYRTKLTPHFDAPPRWVREVHSKSGKLAVRGGFGIKGGGKEVYEEMDEEEMINSGVAAGGFGGVGKGVGGVGKEVGESVGEDVGVGIGPREGVEGAKQDAGEVNGEGERGGYLGEVSERGNIKVEAGGVKVFTSDDGEKTWRPNIGFDKRSGLGIVDIEECPIAMPVLNQKLTEERRRINRDIMQYSRAATILLRSSIPPPTTQPFDPSTPELPPSSHLAITDHHAPVFERVGDFLFTFSANSFFQNNNSILPSLISYVKSAIFPTLPTDSPARTRPPLTHLVDTYCGSGLFGISLSGEFERVAGVEIAADSIEAARRNARLNGLGEGAAGKMDWVCGKAEEIFEGLGKRGFGGGNSCVIVDPPRKGCDESFLQQLLAYQPQTIVYVSCNVHTQARDVGWFIHHAEGAYVLESLRGFDLFPQTAHVESVAVLRRL